MKSRFDKWYRSEHVRRCILRRIMQDYTLLYAITDRTYELYEKPSLIFERPLDGERPVVMKQYMNDLIGYQPMTCRIRT